MKLKQADIFVDVNTLDYICITTNATSKANGDLTMGAGIALTASKYNPKLKVEFGRQLRERNLFNKFYGLLLAEEKFIAFQTKIHWKDPSPIEVVSGSVDMLKRLALKYPDKTFGLPFPAINNGGQSPSVIYPMLQCLPDNVVVYHLQSLKL